MSLFFLGSFELEFLLLFWGLILPQIEVRLGSSSPVGLVNLFWSKTRVHSGPLPMRSFLVCRMYFRVASFFGFFCSFVFSLCSLSSTLSAVVVVCYSVFFWWVFSSFSVPSSACWWTGVGREIERQLFPSGPSHSTAIWIPLRSSFAFRSFFS